MPVLAKQHRARFLPPLGDGQPFGIGKESGEDLVLNHHKDLGAKNANRQLSFQKRIECRNAELGLGHHDWPAPARPSRKVLHFEVLPPIGRLFVNVGPLTFAGNLDDQGSD